MEMTLSKILVVDDDITTLTVIMENFGVDAFEVMYAPNGLEGYNVAEKEIPDIIIMDWDMPLMNGIDTIKRLQSTSTTRDIPIVMATGVMTSAKDLKEALEAGAIDYLRKPFNTLELTSRVKTALKLNQSYQLIKKQNQEVKALMEREITYKDRELMLQTMHTLEKSDFLTRIRGHIANMEKRSDPSALFDDIKQLKKNIDNHLRTDNYWDRFTIHFKNIHPHFFQNLKSHYPDITNNEQRLCAYVKIGLRNKEISQILGVTAGTTKTNLNRLKKKLSLKPEDTLRDFIEKLPS